MSEEKPEELLVEDVDVDSNGGDAGAIFRFQCPKCGTRLHWARMGWWDATCRCGLKWEVEVLARGRPVEKDEP